MHTCTIIHALMYFCLSSHDSCNSGWQGTYCTECIPKTGCGEQVTLSAQYSDLYVCIKPSTCICMHDFTQTRWVATARKQANASAILAMLDRTVILVKPLYTWEVIKATYHFTHVALYPLCWVLAFIVLLLSTTQISTHASASLPVRTEPRVSTTVSGITSASVRLATKEI